MRHPLLTKVQASASGEAELAEGWRLMSKEEAEDEDVDFGVINKQSLVGDAHDVLSTIDKAVAFADRMRTEKLQKELDERGMVKSNHMVTLRVVLHGGGETCNFRCAVGASAPFANVQKTIVERLGNAWISGAMRLSWLKSDGVVREVRERIRTLRSTDSGSELPRTARSNLPLTVDADVVAGLRVHELVHSALGGPCTCACKRFCRRRRRRDSVACVREEPLRQV